MKIIDLYDFYSEQFFLIKKENEKKYSNLNRNN